MADKQETSEDIIAEMNRVEVCADGEPCLRDYARRFDAAHKREIDEIKKQVADLQQQLPKPDPNWRDICAKCFENGATEPPDCKYYTEDGCMSPIPDQHPLIQVGDCAKLREALEMVRDAHYTKEVEGELCEGFEVEADDGTGRPLICVVEDALAAPPRNCDIYNNESCRMAYHLHGDGLMTMQAFADWLFAPATEQEGENDER